MANPPPPYANVTGTSAIIGKYNQQENITNVDGNARPGQLVVDLDVDPPVLYIGNNLGNLSLVGGGSGNGTVYGSNTWVQYNNNGNFGGTPAFTFNSDTNVLSATYFSGDGSNLTNVNLTGAASGNTTEIQFNDDGNFDASANLTFNKGTGLLTVVGNITANAITANSLVGATGSNLYVTGNLLPTTGDYSLGLASNPWQDAFFGPQSISILSEDGNPINTVVLSNDVGNTILSAGGFVILGNGIPIFEVQAYSGQLFSNAKTIIQNTTNADNTFNQGALQVKGGGSVVKDFYVGGNIYGNGGALSNVVTYVTAGVGLTGGGTGNIGIDATGVQSITGTANRVIVTDLGGQNFNLSTPQDLNTNSTLTFANLTITGDLTVNGTTTTANSANLDSKVLYLAANSTSAAQIDQGGIILGNANAAYAVSILYDLPNDRWDTNGAGLTTLDLYATNASITGNLWANGNAHFGGSYTGVDFANAVVQMDSNINEVSKLAFTNHSNGTLGTTMFLASNDLGIDDPNYTAAFGIVSSNFNAPLFPSLNPNDGFMSVGSGNLVVSALGANKNIQFYTGGGELTDLSVTISDTGILTPGNVTANFFIGNGSQLTGIVAGNITGQVANALVAGTVYTNAQPNITSVGTLTSLTVSGNITSGNANLGNVATANFFVGNGYGLTNINVSNVVGTIANANYAAYAGNVVNSLTINNSGTGAASGATFNGGSPVTISYNTVGAPKADGTGASGTWAISITGNANVANTANAVAGANVSGQVAYAAIANAVAGANVSGQVGNALVAGTVYTNAQPNITSVGTLTGLTSNGVINFANTSNVTLGAVGNLHISGGSANYVLQTNGSNTLSWVAQAGIGAITTITPNALSSSVHIAATVSGNTANIITDATTANTANTIVVRDANGAINVNGWTVGTHLTAVNYTATNSDYWIGTTTKNKTITLPNAANGASTGRQYQIADVAHDGNPDTTITAQSPATVNGNQPSQQSQIIIATYVGGVWYLN